MPSNRTWGTCCTIFAPPSRPLLGKFRQFPVFAFKLFFFRHNSLEFLLKLAVFYVESEFFLTYHWSVSLLPTSTPGKQPGKPRDFGGLYIYLAGRALLRLAGWADPWHTHNCLNRYVTRFSGTQCPTALVFYDGSSL